MHKNQPMDFAVQLWRFNTDNEYQSQIESVVAAGRKYHRSCALRLIELCESGDPSDFYMVVERFKPDAYIVAELVKMVKTARDIERAKAGGHAKHAADPKQAIKQNVRDCWERWQKNKHEYKSKSAFARAMLDKYGELESQRVIERWCKEWESEPSQ